MVAGSAMITLNDALAKWLTASYPVGQILFLRGLFVGLPIIYLAWRAGGVQALKPHDIRGQIIRAALFVTSSTLFVYSVSIMALPTVVALSFTAPLFITALAPLILREHVGWRRWAAVTAGFLGVLFIVRPFQDDWHWQVLIPIVAALAGSLRDISTRRISAGDTSTSILLYSTIAVTGVGLMTWPLGWAPVAPFDAALLAIMGIAIGAAHYLFIEAFRLTEAALVAPFKYSSLIWAIVLGATIWGDVPDRWALLGSGIILGSGIYILHREMRTLRKAAA